jgi:uncharacterized membrane protein
MVVHFPIALAACAFLVETLALLFKKPAWHRAALWNLALGAAGAALAVITGRLAGAAAKHSFEIHKLMEFHERLGYAAAVLLFFVAGWRLAKKDLLTPRSRRLAWAFLGLAVGIIAFGAHLGGRMVYEFGVGGSYGRGAGIEVIR